MLNLFWWLLPDGALPLIIVMAALGLITGLISRGKAFGMIGIVVVILALSPFLGLLIDAMPMWMVLLLAVFLCFSFFRAVLNALIGQRAAAHTVGILASDVIRFFVRLLFFPFRLLLR